MTEKYRYPKTFGCRGKRKAQTKKPPSHAQLNRRKISVRSGHKPCCPHPFSADGDSLKILYFNSGITEKISNQCCETGGKNVEKFEKTVHDQRIRSESPLEFYIPSNSGKSGHSDKMIAGTPLGDEEMKFLKKCSKQSGIAMRTFLQKYIPQGLTKAMRDAPDIQRILESSWQI